MKCRQNKNESSTTLRSVFAKTIDPGREYRAEVDRQQHNERRASQRGHPAYGCQCGYYRDETRWDQLTPSHDPPDLPLSEWLEVAVLIIHTPHLPERISGKIVGNDIRHEQNPTATTQDAVVELIVLIPH